LFYTTVKLAVLFLNIAIREAIREKKLERSCKEGESRKNASKGISNSLFNRGRERERRWGE
jgi:hypothetical protein